jgi:hypothetical protein
MPVPPKYVLLEGEFDAKGRQLARGPNGALVTFTKDGKPQYASNKAERARKKAAKAAAVADAVLATGPTIIVEGSKATEARALKQAQKVPRLRAEMPMLVPVAPAPTLTVPPQQASAQSLYVSAP